MKRVGPFTCFWGKQDSFSQWHPAPFEFKGRRFATTEQWMMYCKAMLFADLSMAEAILAEPDPAVNKKQGRQVQGFVEDRWNQKARHYVYVGNREKFSQNPPLLAELLSTEGTTLVEASPYDRIWGVGLSAEDPRILDPKQWRGTNWLGQTLTDLRDSFLQEIREGRLQRPLPSGRLRGHR